MTARKPPAEPVYGECRFCGERFRLYRPWQTFCSPRHRDAAKARRMRADARTFRRQQAEAESKTEPV